MILQKVHFAYILEQIQKRLGIHVDTHVVAIMYHEYIAKYYDMYTIFELISLLNERNIHITCALNKRALWKMIVDRQISIPDMPFDDNKKRGCTQWYIYNIYHTGINIIAIKNLSMRFEIIEGDIYQIDNVVYKVTKIAEDSHIILNDDVKMTIDTFIKKLDDCSTTILLNNIISGRTPCIDEIYGR